MDSEYYHLQYSSSANFLSFTLFIGVMICLHPSLLVWDPKIFINVLFNPNLHICNNKEVIWTTMLIQLWKMNDEMMEGP